MLVRAETKSGSHNSSKFSTKAFLLGTLQTMKCANRSMGLLMAVKMECDRLRRNAFVEAL
jgi:hypothetical protein